MSGSLDAEVKHRRQVLLLPGGRIWTDSVVIAVQPIKPIQRTQNIKVYKETGAAYDIDAKIWHLNDEYHALVKVTFKNFITISIRKFLIIPGIGWVLSLNDFKHTLYYCGVVVLKYKSLL